MAEAVINISELRNITDSLFDALESQGLERIEVKQNEYWRVYFADAFNSGQPALFLGDVFDDLNDLRTEVKSTNNDAVIAWHAFSHLSSLMTLVAYAAESGDFVKRVVAEKSP